jgi:hypothetical protein
MPQVRLTWNTPALTSETFDDEVVIVNFGSGKYHSLQGSGRRIWEWLGSGPTLDAVVDRGIASFEGDPGSIGQSIRAFIEMLTQEGLVVPVPDGAPEGVPSGEPSPREPFAAPALNTFSDMQELLLLDPIHEVDEAGWPVARQTTGD